MPSDLKERIARIEMVAGPLWRLILIAIAILSLSWYLLTSGKSKPKESEKGQEAPAPLAAKPAAVSAAADIAVREQQEALLKQPWGRDPFSEMNLMEQVSSPSPQTSDGSEEMESFVLTGIVVRGSEKIAIINRRFTSEGAVVRDAQVIQIGPDYVILQRDQEQIRLQLEVS